MNRDLVKQAGSILLVGVAMLVVLTACGGTNSGAPPAPTVATATTTVKQPAIPVVTTTVVPAPIPTASVALPASPQPAGRGNSDLLPMGKLIFEKTAGGVGCAYCHGLDGKGKGPAGVDAPPNRGKTEEQLRYALAGGVTDSGNPPLMTFIKLTDEEIAAVVAYLQYLAEQP